MFRWKFAGIMFKPFGKNQSVIKLDDTPVTWTAATQKHAVMKLTWKGVLWAHGICLFINEALNMSRAAYQTSVCWVLTECLSVLKKCNPDFAQAVLFWKIARILMLFLPPDSICSVQLVMASIKKKINKLDASQSSAPLARRSSQHSNKSPQTP